MKKLVKLVMSIALAISMAACTKPAEKMGALKVLCPTGAPATALIGSYNEIVDNGGSVTFVEGPAQLQAELTKNDSEYDVIIAPVNLGCALAKKGVSSYKLKGILTWGNLYLVGTSKEALNGEGNIALFGEGAVPQKVYETTNVSTTLKPTYFAEASLVVQQLVSGKAKVGMLAEPAATACIAKAKQAGVELTVVENLQALYGEEGYPQAALFAKDAKANGLCDSIAKWCDSKFEGINDLTDELAEKMGLPAAQVVIKSIERQNINYKDAKDVTEAVTKFLKLFNIEFSDDLMM